MYSILPALVACYFLVIGSIVWTKSRHQRTHITFALLCATTFVWQITWAVLFQTNEHETATSLIKFGYLFIIFLPTILYHFLVEVSRAYAERRFVYWSYGACLVLAIILLTSNLFVNGYYEYYWGYYPQAGALHPLHVLQTSVVVLRGLYIAYQQLRKATHPLKEQLRYCIMGLFVYFFAAIDYACNYGFEFYPPGIIFITISLTIIAYALAKKELLDIQLIVPRWGAHLFIAFLVTVTFSSTHLLSSHHPKTGLLLTLIAALLWVKYGDSLRHKLQTSTEQKWIRNWYDPNEITNLVMRRLQPLLNRHDIIQTVTNTLNEVFKSAHGYALIQERAGFVYHKNGDSACHFINSDHPQVRYLTDTRYKPVYSQELPHTGPHPSAIDCTEDCTLLPLHSASTLEGVIVLNGRFSATNLYGRDRQFLETLARQIDVFLDRADAHNKLITEAVAQHEKRVMLTKAIAGNISHELRTPLTTIGMTARAMEAHWSTLWQGYELGKQHSIKTGNSETPLLAARHEAGLKDGIKSIARATRLSQTIITMLMENVRQEQISTENFVPLSAASCVHKALQDYPFQEHETALIRFEESSDFIFKGSEALFVYVIYNLLKNALYYLAKANKGDIQIWFEPGEEANTLYFRDSGCGIDAKTINHIFEPFFTTKPSGVGNGLGLPFCKRVIESFGGSIRCQSRLGDYTEFLITLPKTTISPE